MISLTDAMNDRVPQEVTHASDASFFNGTAKECYDALKAPARREGPVKQVALIREALSVLVSEPLDPVARKICELVDRAFANGEIDKDVLKCTALLNLINDKSFEAIQTQVSRVADSTTDKLYTSSDIRKLFQTIDSVQTIRHRPHCENAKSPHSQPWMALAKSAVRSATHSGHLVEDTLRSGVLSQEEEWQGRQ